MFKTTMENGIGKGMLITFENGVTASIRIGVCNYCDSSKSSDSIFGRESKNCEICAWDKNNNDILLEEMFGAHDGIAGWVSANDIPAFLEFCSKYSS